METTKDLTAENKKLIKENSLLRRRVKALENLLVCLGIGTRPTENLFKELEATSKIT